MQRDDISTALADIRAERVRQMHVEGWSPEHDDRHNRGEIANAAAAYAVASVDDRSRRDCVLYAAIGTHPGSGANAGWVSVSNLLWPWSREWWKPKSYRENLVRAAALLVAEIERIDRAERSKSAAPAA